MNEILAGDGAASAAPSKPQYLDAYPAIELVAWSMLACGISLLNRIGGNFFRIPSFGTPLGHLLSILLLAALLYSLVRGARSAAQLTVSAGFQVVTGLIIGLPVLLSILSGFGATGGAIAHLAPIASLIELMSALPQSAQFAISNLLGPIAMLLLGAGIGRLMKHTHTLLAGAGFAIFFDIVIVTLGPVAQLLKSGSNLISTVSVGAGGTPQSGGHLGPLIAHTSATSPISTVTIGPADVLFMAFFLSSVYALRLSLGSSFWWMYGLLLSALVLVELTGLPIPALAPMGISILIANARYAAFTRTEKRDLWIGAAFAICCAGVMVGVAHRLVPPPPPHFGFRPVRLSANGPLFVEAVAPGSPAEKGGLRAGDIILELNGTPTRGMTGDQFATQIENSVRDGLGVRVQRRGEPHPRLLRLRPDGR